MQPARRRLWIWTLTTAAAAVVIGATLSALFSFTMRVAPGYRAQVEQQLQQAAGEPLRIGALSLRWRGLDPVLVLDEVSLASAEQRAAAQLGRVELQFSPLRLAVGDRLPHSVRLRGLMLRLHHQAEGRWYIEGIDTREGGDRRPALRALGGIARLQLDNTRIICIDDAGTRAAQTLTVPHAELSTRGYRHRLQAQVQPPPGWGRLLRIEATATGALEEPASLEAEWSAQLDDIGVLPEVRAVLAEDVQLTLDALQLHASGHVRGGVAVDVSARISARRIAGARGQQPLAEWRDVTADAQWQPRPDGWHVHIDTLRYTNTEMAANAPVDVSKALQRGGAGPFELQWQQQGGAATTQLSGDQLQLADVAPWLAMLRGLPPPMRPLQGLSGELHRLSLALLPAADGASRHAPRYALSGTVSGLALAGDEQRPGVSGLSGELQATEQGGEFRIDAPTLRVDWPDMFETPLQFDAATASLRWQHEAGRWHIGVEPLAIKLGGLEVGGQIGIGLPQEGSGQLDMDLALSADDVAPLMALLPRKMGPRSREWLQRAIEGGRLSKGQVQIHGALDGFPYPDPASGHWQADLMLERAQLAFSRQWPALREVKAQLHFAGSALDVDLQRGKLGEVYVDPTQGHIADLHSSDLLIDGTTHGNLAAYYALLRGSPVRERLTGLLGSTDASGGGEVELHLAVPVHEEHPEVHANGTVRLDNVRLQVRGLDPPITGVRGQLSFGPGGVVSERLVGQLMDAALVGSIHPEPDVHEGVLRLAFPLSADAPDGLFAHYVPAVIRERLQGHADWQLRLPFSGPDSGRPVLSSTLQGISSRLPPPLRKHADERLPLRLQIAAALIRIDVPDSLALALRLDSAAHGGVRGIEARFGGGDAPRAEADGIVVTGSSPLVDVPAWTGFAGRIGNAAAPPSSAAAEPSHYLQLTRVDVDAQRLAIGELRIPHARVLVEPIPDGYRVRLDGDGGHGSIDLLRSSGGRMLGRFDTLHLLREPPAKAAAEPAAPRSVTPPAVAAEPPFEPADWPQTSLDIAHLYVADAELGQLALRTERVSGGQRLAQLHIGEGLVDFDGSGQWTRVAGASSAYLDFRLDAREIGRVLQGLGYAETLTGERGHFDGRLQWGPEAAGLAFAQAQGDVAVDVERGAIRAVEPGAGRILGLFNLYALPRRLLLNFSDVTRKGLGFDRLQGHFTLAGGNAHTDDLDMAGPSLQLQVRGRIGLAARDFDEHVSVTPTGVTTGVTVGAALLGGPAGAAIALLAQQLFDKPLDKLTRFSYRVTGSWDNPEITRGEGPAEPEPAPAGVPEPAAEPAPAPASK